MPTVNAILKRNQKHAEEILSSDSFYYKNLAKTQKPEFFWLGCCDSRVPAEVITGCKPGELFVTRNIANQCHCNDLNTHCALKFAAEVLGTKKILVCGHSHCGGVAAALSGGDLGLLNHVIDPVKAVYDAHQADVDAAGSEEEKIVTLAKLNVTKQIDNIRQLDFITDDIEITGMIYHIDTGLLETLP